MLKFIRNVITAMISVIVALLLAVFLLPRAFGYQPYMVVSASMKQVFPVGSLIFVTDAQPEDISVGDPITFTSGTLTITHRVMAIDEENRIFTTKGDNNNASELVSFENLKGKALNFSIPYFGYFSSWFTTAQGKITFIIIILGLVLLNVMLGKIDEADDDEGIDAKEGEADEQ